MQMMAPAVAMIISPMMLEAPRPRRPASSPPTTAPMMPIRRLSRRSWRRPRIQDASAPAIRPTTRKMIMPMMLLSPCARGPGVPGQGSDVKRAAVSVEHRFAHHLRQCWMGEDGCHQFGLGGFEGSRDGEALDQLGRLGAEKMGAKQGAALGIEDR